MEPPILPPPPLEPAHNFFSKRSLFTFLGVLIILLTLPVGVYLTLSGTNFLPKAVSPTSPPQTAFFLETAKTKLNLGDQFTVTIKAKSDLDEANLFLAKLQFSKDVLEVENVATESGKITKWVEKSFDNSQGVVNIIGGMPDPGIKTDYNDSQDKITLAKITFKTKGVGTGTIQFSDLSQIFRNTDNNPILQSTSKRGDKGNLILQKKNQLDISILDLGGGSSSSASLLNSFLNQSPNSTSLKSLQQASSSAQILVLSPKGGVDFQYLSPIDILWQSSKPLSQVNLSLFMNNQYFGEIAGNLPDNGRYSWDVSKTIPLVLASLKNTFQIQVSGVTKTGEALSGMNNGPFGILTKEVSGSTNLPDGTSLEIIDVSKMLSNYFKEGITDRKVDLNGDGLVNDLDFWLGRVVLLNEKLIQE